MTEAFPKSGHVNEVCKKWVVQEDGALAYQLQSQEFNEFYRGNKFRNAVVRQDFPTALHEQIKEKESAEKQAALYYRMIAEQEQTDARIAKQLSRKMEEDLKREKLITSEESENVAKQLQSVYVETASVSSIQVKKQTPIPEHIVPFSNNPSAYGQSELQFSQSSCSSRGSDGGRAQHKQNNPSLQNIKHKHSKHQHQSQHQHCESSPPELPSRATKPLATPAAAKNISSQLERLNIIEPEYPPSLQPLTSQPLTLNLHSHTPEKKLPYQYCGNPNTISSPATSPASPTSPTSYSRFASRKLDLPKQYSTVDSFSDPLPMHLNDEYSDVADSIRQYDLSLPYSQPIENVLDTKRTGMDGGTSHAISNFDQTDSFKKYKAAQDDNKLKKNFNLQKLSAENYDYLMGNINSNPTDEMRQKFAADQLGGGTVASAGEANRISGNDVLSDEGVICGNADENLITTDPLMISNLDSPIRIAALQELGLPSHEIKEIDRKLRQEKSDEELARLLQEQEQEITISQEEKDRKLAIEAQDKELARMLQEREKAKAKRAKERARLRKMQKSGTNDDEDVQPPLSPEEQEELLQQQYVQQTKGALSFQSGYVSLNIDKDPYSNPVDMIPSPKSAGSAYNKFSTVPECRTRDADELHEPHDDTIYTLPFDSEQKNLHRQNADRKKPTDLIIAMPKGSSKHTERTDNIAAMIDPTFVQLQNSNSFSSSSGNSFSNSGLSRTSPSTGIPTPTDDSSSPVPPYMPIQGTRRNTSLDGKKKKSKDKCTHQ